MRSIIINIVIMEIKSWADWPEVERELMSQIRSLNYNPDLNKMKRNLDAMVTELNKAEVEARRIKNYRYLEPKIAEVNRAINQLEQWIFLLLLRQ